MSGSRRYSLLCCLVGAACAAPAAAPLPAVASWGTMREVLAEGRDQGRVELTGRAQPGVIGVGALAGLAGEVTIADGRVLVAVASGASCEVRDARPGEQAALLVTSTVERWVALPLPACPDYAALEAAIAQRLGERGIDVRQPVPVRVRGRASRLALHVIAGSCPVAHPEGPPPWRHEGPAAQVELVGVYVEGAAGRLTHHTHDSHLHAIADGRMGHLDEVALEDAVLFLPAR